MARFAYLECHCSLFRTVRSEACPWSVATLLSSALYRTLAIAICKSEKTAAKLHLAVSAAAVNFIVSFCNDHGRSFPLFANLVARSRARSS